MTALTKRVRPSLTDLLWSTWPFEEIGGLEVLGKGGLTMRMEEFVEDDHTLVLRAELPGLDVDRDVEITVDKGMLTIGAERKEHVTEGEEGTSGYRSEFRYGSYRRTLTLPRDASADDIKATYADGILEVRVPIAPAVPTTQKVAITKA